METILRFMGTIGNHLHVALAVPNRKECPNKYPTELNLYHSSPLIRVEISSKHRVKNLWFLDVFRWFSWKFNIFMMARPAMKVISRWAFSLHKKHLDLAKPVLLFRGSELRPVGLVGYKWANALVPPTPFQGWRKKCADIEPLKKPSKRLGLNIVKHTYVYIYI